MNMLMHFVRVSVLLQHIPAPNERHARSFCMPVNYWNVTDVKLGGRLLWSSSCPDSGSVLVNNIRVFHRLVKMCRSPGALGSI